MELVAEKALVSLLGPAGVNVFLPLLSMKRSLLGPPSLAIEVLRAAKIDLLSVQRKQLVSTLRF